MFLKIYYWRFKDFSLSRFFKRKFDNLQINIRLFVIYRIKFFKMNFYSQQNEDKYLYSFFNLDKTKNGTYLELGACDGKLFSNTLSLNKINNFVGILIEPQNDYFKELKINRPNDYLYNCVITNNTSNEVMFIGENLEAGVFNSISTDLNRYPNWKKIKLENRMLKDIIKDSKFQYLDIVSIDTEGSEYEILKSFDFKKYKPLVFTIEHNYTELEDKIDQLMFSNNYVRIFQKLTAFDSWYVLKDLV